MRRTGERISLSPLAKLNRLFSTSALVLAFAGCSILTTRPVQDMSDTAAAIRAAREVQADTLAPELYRQANEWFFRAKNEYKFKNFSLAKDYTLKARLYAEQAEFESMRNGGLRSETATVDPLANTPAPQSTDYKEAPAPPKPDPYPYPTPTPVSPDSLPPAGGSQPTAK